MKKIVVIGSNSFSGQDFIDLLLEKNTYQVTGISRSPEKSALFLSYKQHASPHFTFYQLDINHDYQKLFALFQKIKPDYIVNFAAQSEVAPSWEHPEQWFETNAVAIARLGNYLTSVNYLKRYVHISSPEVYGTCEGNVTESAPLNPTTPYAASKAAGDLLLFTLVKNFKFPLVMIRSTNVYGARQQLFKIIPRSIINIKLGKKIQLHGGGTAIKSYIHIRDISKGELAAMEKGNLGEIYHFSPEHGIAVKEVVQMICRKLDVPFAKVAHVAPERLGQDAAYVIDSTKARTKLGWQPHISFDEGISEVIDWVNANWTDIQKLPHEYQHKP